ncbi:hypothetical protein MVUOKPPV_CDS0308 [Klebsiella phage phi1_175008]|uniref:Uncharacterized protein n=1 Tax=Klebsiella phage phi1_175008 TaxID=3127744 RepID=A0ACD5FRL0_9CAUD
MIVVARLMIVMVISSVYRFSFGLFCPSESNIKLS